MNNIGNILKEKKFARAPKKETEYGQLQDYFLSLGMKDKNDRLLSREAIGFLLMPIYRKGGTSLVHDLRAACERSDRPSAVFWMNVRIKK